MSGVSSELSIVENEVNDPITLPDLLSLDPSVVYGELQNGMKYYIKPNKKPKNRVELRIAIRAGSINEKEEERGIAHMVEHLAFRASKSVNSKSFDIIRTLEAMGIKFGAHQNAYTSFHETVYELHIPVDDSKMLKKCLYILRQLVLDIRCSDADVEAERAIIIEEWRQTRSSSKRAGEAFHELLLAGSLYAERLPIGLLEVIQTVPPTVVREFYQRWYQPANMAIIAVGDFRSVKDEHAVLDLINEVFVSTLPMHPINSINILVPLRSHPVARVFKDPEITTGLLRMEYKRHASPIKTVLDYRTYVVEELFHAVLNERFVKISAQSNTPFLGCSSSSSELVPSARTMRIVATVEKYGELHALKSILEEIERVRQHGFTKNEVERSKSNLRSELEGQMRERDQVESSEYAEEYIEHYLRNEPSPGIEKEITIINNFLGNVSTAEVASFIQFMDPLGDLTVQLQLPQPGLMERWLGWINGSQQKKTICENDIITCISNAKDRSKRDMKPWKEKVHTKLLVDCPIPGTIVWRKKYDASGIEEVKLSNGMVVAWKVTDYLDDEIVISGASFGGLSEVDEKMHMSARIACMAAKEIGVFGIPPEILGDKMAGKIANISPNINTYFHRFDGDCSISDLKTALELIHLLFITKIIPNQERLATKLRYLAEQVANRRKNPQDIFNRTVTKINTCDHYYERRTTLKDVECFDIPFACEYFNDLFSNPSSFKVVLAGKIDPVILIPLLETYLASIPIPGKHTILPDIQSHKDLKPIRIKFPDHSIHRTLRLPMVEQMCCTEFCIPVVFGVTNECKETRLREMYLLANCCGLLETHLMEVLRFELGSIYNVEAGFSFSRNVPAAKERRGICSIFFTCHPKQVTKLSLRIEHEMMKVRNTMLSKEKIDSFIKSQLLILEEAQETNSYWQLGMLNAYISPRYAGNISETFFQTERVRKASIVEMKPNSVRDCFKKYFNASAVHTRITLISDRETKYKKTLMAGFCLLTAATIISKKFHSI